MTQNVWLIASIWMALALSASLISIWAGVSVALVEIVVGVIAGNFLGLHATTEWINFLALLGSGVLTFLAGAEIDPLSLKANLRVSLLIGVLSFGIPFAAVWMFAQLVLGWPLHQAQIAGIALSTTSVAVVYAVMIEGGLSETPMGKMILAACFITDLGTVLALGTLFAEFNRWLVVFIVTTLLLLWFMPRWTESIIRKLGATRVSEPEVKFVCVVAGAVDSTRRDRGPAFAENGDEDRGRVSARAAPLHESARCKLHDLTHGDGPDFWDDLGAVRFAKPHHRPAPIHDSGHDGDPERVRPNIDRAKVFPAEYRRSEERRVGKECRSRWSP